MSPPLTRPEGRPPPSVRGAVATVLSIWAVLQAATLVVAAVRGGSPDHAFTFLYTGMFTAALVFAAWRAWAWTAAARSLAPPAEDGADDAARRHAGLSGEEPPPPRW